MKMQIFTLLPIKYECGALSFNFISGLIFLFRTWCVTFHFSAFVYTKKYAFRVPMLLQLWRWSILATTTKYWICPSSLVDNWCYFTNNIIIVHTHCSRTFCFICRIWNDQKQSVRESSLPSIHVDHGKCIRLRRESITYDHQDESSRILMRAKVHFIYDIVKLLATSVNKLCRCLIFTSDQQAFDTHSNNVDWSLDSVVTLSVIDEYKYTLGLFVFRHTFYCSFRFMAMLVTIDTGFSVLSMLHK